MITNLISKGNREFIACSILTLTDLEGKSSNGEAVLSRQRNQNVKDVYANHERFCLLVSHDLF